LSNKVFHRSEEFASLDRGALDDLLEAPRPAAYFGNSIGDSLLTLPTLRALGEMFASPITLICPKFAFDLSFWEVSPLLIDITGYPTQGPYGRLGDSYGPFDYDVLLSQIGAVDVFINTGPWNLPDDQVIEPLWQHLAPTTSIGFAGGADFYDILIPKALQHTADWIFNLAQLFDPSARIETYAKPVPTKPYVQEKAESIRSAQPPGTKVLVVHADTKWKEKEWTFTRFIDLLDRFLSRHREFVAWVVGMGHEELNVGRERDRVIPYLGLPLDLTMSMVAHADFFVGIDSCMLHAADLARIPGVGLFGPTRSATWGFRFASHRHVDVRSMADLAVEEVLDAMEDLLREHL
jgi:Glycosyltransferase family 9 (heptosyltransferase)